MSIPEVLFFQEGPGVRNTQYTTKGVKLLNVANLVDGKIDLSTSDRYISEEEAYGKYKHFLCDAGDFVIASSGIKVEYIDKKMGFVDSSMLPLCMNTSTIRFKVLDENKLRIRYFMYYLKSRHFKEQLFRQITGSAQLNYGPSHLKKMVIPLISLDEQDEIIACMDKVQNVIALRQQELTYLDDLVKARFVELFGDPKQNRLGWEMSTVGDVVASCEAGWSGNGTQREKRNGEIAVLKVSAVTKGYFIPEECKVLDNQDSVKKYVYPQAGDLLFSRANTREMVGATAVVTADYPEHILPDKLWKIRFLDKANVWYMKYVLSSESIRSIFSTVSTGTSGSMFNVSMDKFKSIKIPLPPLEIQQQFADFVVRTDKSKSAVQKSLDETQVLFDSLMQKYFG